MKNRTLEIELSDVAYRKLRALSILSGCDNAEDMEKYVCTLFEETLNRGLHAHVGVVTNQEVPPYTTKKRYSPRTKPVIPTDSPFDIADGLGDEVSYEAEEITPETNEEAFVPPKGGLSDRDIEEDMQIEDPQHEAQEEPPVLQIPLEKSEDIFSSILGLPLPEEDSGEIDHRILKRKKSHIKHNATVTGLMEDAQIKERF